MKLKTIDLLKMCSMENGSAVRIAEWRRLCDIYSTKAVIRKLEELADRGYIEYGVSVRGAWLTEKGKCKLREVAE